MESVLDSLCLIVAPVTDQRLVSWEKCVIRETNTVLLEQWDIPKEIRDQLQAGTLVLNGIGIRRRWAEETKIAAVG